MDKKIVDKLIQFGLITNVGVDANKYTDVDDLIAKGIITIPGAKAKIMELIGNDSIVVEELPVNDDTVVDNAEDTAAVDATVEETAEEVAEVVVEEAVEDVVSDTTIVEEVAEVVVEETTVEETDAKSEKKSGKSSKND